MRTRRSTSREQDYENEHEKEKDRTCPRRGSPEDEGVHPQIDADSADFVGFRWNPPSPRIRFAATQRGVLPVAIPKSDPFQVAAKRETPRPPVPPSPLRETVEESSSRAVEDIWCFKLRRPLFALPPLPLCLLPTVPRPTTKRSPRSTRRCAATPSPPRAAVVERSAIAATTPTAGRLSFPPPICRSGGCRDPQIKQPRRNVSDPLCPRGQSA